MSFSGGDNKGKIGSFVFTGMSVFQIRRNQITALVVSDLTAMLSLKWAVEMVE